MWRDGFPSRDGNRYSCRTLNSSLPSPLLECVLNLSEGRNEPLLTEIAGAIAAIPGCKLLHQDTGAGAHRTVFTFAGRPEAVFAAARRVYELAVERIDMRRHTGEHPRLGAVDVCPFVPIRGIELAEVAARSREFGETLARDLNIPIYCYEASASADYRRSLASIRKGEYEGLPQKLGDPRWQPDYGPTDFRPRFGASVLGARPFLIAWNINLDAGASPILAKTLASRVRARGGLFTGLRAIGWYIPEFGRCQVSCNVVDPDRVDLARVYLTVANLAQAAGHRVTGSELIGLIPERYLRGAAAAFAFEPLSRAEELNLAVDVLGLNDLAPFDWRERVLEELLEA